MNNQKNIKYCMSACLVGVPCRYSGKSKLYQNSLDIYLEGETLVICPEILSGLPTPRPACEIVGGEGEDVLLGTAKVIDKNGKDYSEDFINGAKKAFEIVKKHNIKKVYLKSGSPSCGAQTIYDGAFDGNTKKGSGVFAALLKREGVEIIELD